jgi:hypothetical protein
VKNSSWEIFLPWFLILLLFLLSVWLWFSFKMFRSTRESFKGKHENQSDIAGNIVRQHKRRRTFYYWSRKRVRDRLQEKMRQIRRQSLPRFARLDLKKRGQLSFYDVWEYLVRGSRKGDKLTQQHNSRIIDKSIELWKEPVWLSFMTKTRGKWQWILVSLWENPASRIWLLFSLEMLFILFHSEVGALNILLHPMPLLKISLCSRPIFLITVEEDGEEMKNKFWILITIINVVIDTSVENVWLTESRKHQFHHEVTHSCCNLSSVNHCPKKDYFEKGWPKQPFWILRFDDASTTLEIFTTERDNAKVFRRVFLIRNIFLMFSNVVIEVSLKRKCSLKDFFIGIQDLSFVLRMTWLLPEFPVGFNSEGDRQKTGNI